MSKSDPEIYSKILLTTPPDQIRKAISRALTDTFDGIYISPERPGITNLLNILAALENKRIEEVEKEFHDWGKKEFKERVAESIIAELLIIQKRYEYVRGDLKWLERIRKRGNERARYFANQRIKLIKEIAGLL